MFRVLFFMLALLANVTAKKAPNIIFIVADDLGWNDISLNGSPQIPTPNIDSLAKDGVVLSNYYASPDCSPSRSAILTGRHAIHTVCSHIYINVNVLYFVPCIGCISCL